MTEEMQKAADFDRSHRAGRRRSITPNVHGVTAGAAPGSEHTQPGVPQRVSDMSEVLRTHFMTFAGVWLNHQRHSARSALGY